jgi:PAS domain-containing protein
VSDLGELVQLVASFIGEERAAGEFPGARPRRFGGPAHRAPRPATDRRVVGASSARTLVASALAGGQMSLHDVTRLLDQGGQSLRFSRQLLAATFENMDAGISVVDAEMNLVAWNSRYEEILDYPPGMVRAGVAHRGPDPPQRPARRFRPRRCRAGGAEAAWPLAARA